MAGERHGAPWTEEDDARLRLVWGERTTPGVARAMGRTTTAVYFRAVRIGLPVGCPQGKEYLTHAARRAGFTLKTLRRILERASVAMRAAMSMPRGRRTGRHHFVVDPQDVDDAVADHMACETPSRASERHRVRVATLTQLLAAAGHVRPQRGRRWLVPSATIDAVMAARRTGG